MDIQGHSRIAGIGSFLPDQVVKSDDLMVEIDSTRFGTPTNYISQTIGIEERRVSDSNTMPSDMAAAASVEAIVDAGINPSDIDMVIYCGIDRDWQEPATAHRVQTLVGAESATCFDVTNACHGFMTGLSIADTYIASGQVDNVLVCTGEKPTEVTMAAVDGLKKTQDEAEFWRWLGSLTVGDAGGAMVVQRSANDGWRHMGFQSFGELAELCYYKRSGDSYEGQMMMGPIVKQLIKKQSQMIQNTYIKLEWTPSHVDRLYCHQVGARAHKILAKVAGVSTANAPITYKHYGNLTSATIPVSMSLHRPQRGSKLLFLGAGSGLSICQAGMIY